jgi:hypothetical protein
MSILPSSAWDTPGEPEPTPPKPTARAKEVAEYLHEMDLLGAFDGQLDCATVLRYCHHRGHIPSPIFRFADVLSGLDEAAASTRRSLLGPIPSDEKEWKTLRDRGDIPAWVRRCPRLVWRMDKKSGEVYSFWAKCESDLCESRCAEVRAEGNLKWACRQFPHDDQVWVAAVPYDDGLTVRLRKRRERKRRQTGCPEGTVWVRRGDGTIHIFSTHDLSDPDDEPRRGRWLSPAEALDALLNLSLALPGVKKVGWSGAWKRPAQRRSEGRTYDLSEQPESLMEEALAEAGDALKEQYGVDALEQMSADQVETIWLPMVKSAIEHQWNMRKQPGDG